MGSAGVHRHERRGTGRFAVVVALVLALLVGASATACTEDRSAEAPTTPAVVGTVPANCGTADLLACARASSIAPLVPPAPIAATGPPITIGMINQENTPVGSFPELSQAVTAAVDFVNDQLGGIDGRPIRLQVCNTKFSAEGSTACGQQFIQDGAPVVLGGIDVFGNGIETLAASGIPFVGGIPVSNQSARSPNSFQWSGGIWGAVIAFAYYAATVDHARSAAIIYGEFGPISEGAEYGKRTLESLGVKDVQLIPHPIIATDLSAPVQVAAASAPDAIFMLEADTGCKSAYDSIANAGVKAKVFYVGSCASPQIVQQAGPEKTNGARYNIESTIDPATPDPDGALYTMVVQHYGHGLDPVGAGTVTFRSFMNLYAVLRGLGPDHLDPASITGALAAQRRTPSFMGHAYSCDGRQFPTLPAMCSPQQVLVEMQNGQLHQLGDWIDVGAVFPG